MEEEGDTTPMDVVDPVAIGLLDTPPYGLDPAALIDTEPMPATNGGVTEPMEAVGFEDTSVIVIGSPRRAGTQAEWPPSPRTPAGTPRRARIHRITRPPTLT